jgi:hypothetical protein
MNCPPCHGNCNQGRKCANSVWASRAALGWPESIQDESPVSPEEARTLFIYAASVLVLLMACTGLVIWFG